MNPITRARNSILKFLSISVDLAVTRIEHAITGRKPLRSENLDLSHCNMPEYFERPGSFYTAGLKQPDMEIKPRRSFAGIHESRFKFSSETETECEKNNAVRGRIFEARQKHGGAAAPCFIILHGWREPGAFTPWHWLLGLLLARLGINNVIMTLPWHGRRKPEGAADGDLMLCGDMQRSVNSVKQAVGDARSLVTWARTLFTGKIGVGGFSLGGFITGIVACADNRIDFAVPIIASGDMAAGMWDSPVAKVITRDLAACGVTEQILCDNWRIMSAVNFTPALPPEKIQLIAGEYDILIPVGNVIKLHEKWRGSLLKLLPCGHVSIFLCSRTLVKTIAGFINGQR